MIKSTFQKSILFETTCFIGAFVSPNAPKEIIKKAQAAEDEEGE